METQTTKAVTKKAPTEIALSTNQTDWDLDTTDSRDMVIPKILIGQSNTPTVQSGQHKAGQIYNSVTGAVLGFADSKTPKTFQFIPFKEEVLWRIEKFEQGRYKFLRVEPRPPTSEKREPEFTENGLKCRTVKLLRYHILLVDELKNPVPFPCILDLKMSNFMVGKTLHNHFVLTKAAMQKKHPVNPADTIFELGGHITTNDKGTFFVYDIKPVPGKSTPESQKVAFEWLQTLKTSTYVVDGADDETEVVVDTSVNTTSQF